MDERSLFDVRLPWPSAGHTKNFHVALVQISTARGKRQSLRQKSSAQAKNLRKLFWPP